MPYIVPPEAKSTATTRKIMLALMGASGNGKTWSALTFPNPVVANFDDNLQAHQERISKGEIQDIPFHNAAFCDKLVKRTLSSGDKSRPNKRDAFTTWLSQHGYKLEEDQTLILDSWTICQDAFDMQKELEPDYTAGGKLDEFAFWAYKQEWSRDVLNILKSLKCHVVVTFHEQYMTDESGKVMMNKLNPLMQGKFINKLPSYFSDWFRCFFFSKGSKLPEEYYKTNNLPEVASSDIGLWQTKSTTVANCKTRMVGAPTFIEANFKSIKY